jgi:hypothetical protein
MFLYVSQNEVLRKIRTVLLIHETLLVPGDILPASLWDKINKLYGVYSLAWDVLA